VRRGIHPVECDVHREWKITGFGCLQRWCLQLFGHAPRYVLNAWQREVLGLPGHAVRLRTVAGTD